MNATNEDSTASEEQASVSSASEKNLIRVQLLGGSKAGKTCFIAGLALLNEQSDGETFVLVNDQNSETMAVFNELRQTLSRGRWPAKTSMPSSLRFALKGAANFGPIRKPLRANVQLTDFSGESFTDAMQRGDDNEAALQVRQMLANADFLM
ncbi:MAG: TRAFAC clade GTPase domain-containing protein, partial [Planctomycetota bacterium]